MESNQPLLNDKNKPLKKTFERIDKLYSEQEGMKHEAEEIQTLESQMSKMWGRFEPEHCQTMMDKLFEVAWTKMESDKDKEILKGLRQAVRAAEHSLYKPQPRYQDAFFFPNMENIKKLVGYIKKAKTSIDLSIFSFTNDDLANEIIAAHKRGCKVRIITDDEAMKGKGADAQRCADEGIPVRCDSEEKFHMHNKFMIVDQTFLVTGSFNWTFQAGKSNQENVIVVDGSYYIDKYHKEFAKLWTQFAANTVEGDQERAALKI